jgi:hypothetical protein
MTSTRVALITRAIRRAECSGACNRTLEHPAPSTEHSAPSTGADEGAEADLQKFDSGMREALAKMAKSDAVQQAIKRAAQNNAEMEERFRTAATQSAGTCGG